MHWRILSMVLFVSCIPGWNAGAEEGDESGDEVEATVDEAPARQTIKVEFDSHSEEHEKLVREYKGNALNALLLPTPTAILDSARAWTEISDRGTRVLVRFIHNKRHSRYVAMSSGDTYSRSGAIKVEGKTLSEHETHVRYEESLTASDEGSFDILGIYEFENGISERRCTVICRIEGKKTATGNPFSSTIHSTGTATWTGPIVDASGSAFREDVIVQSSSRLNENNIDTILDNRNKYTDADLVQLLGPADSIVVGSDLQSPGTTVMLWEEISRIELTFRDGVLDAMSGKFTPHRQSKFIHYPGFKKLHTGMSLYDVHQHCCRGVPAKKKDSDAGTTILIYEAYNRLHVYLKDGKVRSAICIEYGFK